MKTGRIFFEIFIDIIGIITLSLVLGWQPCSFPERGHRLTKCAGAEPSFQIVPVPRGFPSVSIPPQSHPGAAFCTLQAVFGKRELNWSNCFKNSAKAAVIEFLSEFMAHALGWAELLPGAALLLGETKQRGGYGIGISKPKFYIAALWKAFSAPDRTAWCRCVR